MCHFTERRQFLKQSAGVAAALAGAPAVFTLPRLRDLEAERPYLEVAKKAWRWVDASRIATAQGITWPADPVRPDQLGATLYTDAPGVLPLALELFHATEDEEYLDAACAACDHFGATLDTVDGAGLYTGLAGVAFVLAATHTASGRSVYADHAERATLLLIDRAESLGYGIAWPFPSGDGRTLESNDIVSGTAGTALGLLYLYAALGDDRALEAAMLAGIRLAQNAMVGERGTTWEMWPGYAREMPNFSHGTAGVAYTLATLHEQIGEPAFLAAAESAAGYLQSIATVQDGGYRIYHNRPEGEDLYYLSWCHGPVGTNRLFQRLHRATGEAKWMTWVHRGAQGIMQSGIPEQRTPGFWNNISQCCGDAGVGEFFLSFYRETKVPAYRDLADRITANLTGWAREDHGGLTWPQAENRRSPEVIVAQTGFMQGAAGVGKYFLSLDRMERDEGPAVVLPDAV